VFAKNSTITLGAAAAAGSTFSGWLGACTGTGGCRVTLSAPTSVSATFAPDTGLRHIDIDRNDKYDALTDGLLIIRYLFGLTGTPLANGAIGTGATRTDPGDIALHASNIKPRLDVDGNGLTDAYTDGLLLIRYLFGLRGPALVSGAVGTGATRTTAAEIEQYIQSLMPL